MSADFTSVLVLMPCYLKILSSSAGIIALLPQTREGEKGEEVEEEKIPRRKKIRKIK